MNFLAQINWSKLWNQIKVTNELSNCPSPDPQLRLAWLSLQWGIIFVSWNYTFAFVPLAIVMLVTWQRRFQQIVQSRINLGFFLFVLSMILISAFAVNPLESFLGVFNFIPFMIMFAGLVVLLQNPDQMRRLAWLLVISSTPAIAIGFGKFFLGWTSYTNFDISRLAFFVSETPDRMTGTFEHANLFAHYLAIVFAMAIGLWVDTYHRLRALQKHTDAQKMPLKNIDPEAIDPKFGDRDRWIERIHANRQLEIGLGFLTCLLAFNVIGLFLTNSRNGWIAAIATVLAFAIYHRHYLVVGISASFAGSVAGSAFASDPWRSWFRGVVPKAIWSRLNGEMYNNQVAELRTEIWKVAANLTQQRPLTGWGLQSFGKIYEAQTHLWLGHPHNLVLMLTVSVGIPIALFFLSLVGWILAQGVLYLSDWHKSKRALPTNHLIYFTYLTAFGCCTIFQTTDVTIFDPRINFLGWFLLAAILGVANGNRMIRLDEDSINDF